MKIIKKLLPLIIVLALSFWAIKPLFNQGFFPMHDDTQVARVFEMHKSLADGMFPVRWVADLGYGYGYPVFNFYAPLAYYIGGFTMFLGANALVATKIMIGLGIVFAGVFMYLLGREFWGELGGVISGLLYLYAPYHAVDIYVRGDVAEFWAYAFIPLAFFAIYKVFLGLSSYSDLKTNSKFMPRGEAGKIQNSKFKVNKLIWIWVCVAAVAYACIILSHNLTAMMVTPLVFVFAFILYISFRLSGKTYKPYFILLGLLIGIFLSAFYWLPVFPELSFTNVLSVVGGGSNYKDHFVCLGQLWNSPWGFGGSIPGCVDGLSFKIGKIQLILAAFSLPILVLAFQKNKTKFSILIFCVISVLFSTFLTLQQSQFIWEAIPHMAFFQFPWRFLVLISFFTSFLGGAIFSLLAQLKSVWKYMAAAVVVFVIIFLNAKLFMPQRIIYNSSNDYTSKYVLNWTVSKTSDEYMPQGFFKPVVSSLVPKAKLNASSTIQVLANSEKTQEILLTLKAKNNADLIINLAYFPGWHVFIDNNQSWFSYFNKGIIVKVPQGKHIVDIKFTQTTVEKLGNVISLAGVLILILGIMIVHRKDKYNG